MSTDFPESGPKEVISLEKVRQAFGIEQDPGNEQLVRKLDMLLQTVEQRRKLASQPDGLQELASKLGYQGRVKELEHLLREVRDTLDGNKRFAERVEKKGLLAKLRTAAEKTGSFLWRHKWKILIAAAAGLAFLGWKYFPSWDEIMAWTQRMRAAGAAGAANTGVGAAAVAAPAVTPNLTTGGVTPTDPGFPGAPQILGGYLVIRKVA